jgi:DNA-binding Lrp family transcriptional regulator
VPVAYVLFNTDIGAEVDVLARLREVEGVQEAHRLVGVYDIIARVKADSTDALRSIVNQNLRISRVHSKLTVVVTET